MKKWLIIFMLMLFCITVTACSQSQPEEITSDIDTNSNQNINEKVSDNTDNHNEQERSQGFLWKTSTGNNTVYLLGSIHVGQKDMYPLRKEVMEAFEKSDYLVVEGDNSITNDELQKMGEVVKYSDGTTIKDHISKELYDQLEELMLSYRVNASFYNQFKPWYVSMILPSIQVQSAGWELGVDNYFINLAKTKELQVIEIEGVMRQIDILNTLNDFSLEDQESILKATLDKMSSEDDQLTDMFIIWKSGDLKLLESYVDQAYYEGEAFKKINSFLLDDRNIEMVKNIEQLLNSQEEKTYFVVLGAAHYVGEKGIIQLLQDKGYEVIRK